MTFSRIDLYVDLSYGVLLLIGITAMVLLQEYLAAVTFGVGLIIGYAVHIGWRMARFDPQSRNAFEESMEEVVEDQVEESVEDAIDENT